MVEVYQFLRDCANVVQNGEQPTKKPAKIL